MSKPSNTPAEVILIGRSSSHFTRVARVFAAELEVGCRFQVVPDLMSCDPAAYGGNPALKIPVLRAPRGAIFGALNVCRELAGLSSRKAGLVWPEQIEQPLLANAQELVVHAMATEVGLIMARLATPGGGGAHLSKMVRSLEATMLWLEGHAGAVRAALPQGRELSYLEVTLFCLVTHLEFRQVLSTEPYRALRAFCEEFGERASARATAYRFDAV